MKTATDLDEFYDRDDPWDYETTPDDVVRKRRLSEVLPTLTPQRTLDIGCGDGFVTFDLPGSEVVGIDLASRAISAANRKATARPDAARFKFEVASFFDLTASKFGKFDLIVITGVIYKEYLGQSSALVHAIVDDLLQQDGFLISCHIDEWTTSRFPYTLLDTSFYSYRNYIHRLEVHKK
ncbi:2-polyprenyl-3-methyl-5-hydroxy-6-metoxy-1,4-benzoquinol methylase [Microvirga flocculans]|uniref:2-polyprenyl-3-methyl-5-hydroxy-6-metoxy-1, 4-benzoquinol methylase n=1 Tax=Microvirga flocculans TaxID=217168 RepID=A0A7W6IDP8_9HYPH|nr:class I SAM-dependent methyltransferase [Microvirga flocculans]MBB4039578.1 2-polyprenyl-3-methyl-5-hydroxy-6-metoxy-1,4-benzoquinol methylase [Microvirga flocculans]